MISTATLPYERRREKYAGTDDAGVTRPRDGAETARLGFAGVPTGIRTPVTAVKGRCPRPLDDGDFCLVWWR